MSELEQLKQQLEQEKQKNADLLAKAKSRFQVKRSEKSDGIMVLGLRRFPVTFFADEWETLFSLSSQVREVAKTIPTKQMQAVG